MNSEWLKCSVDTRVSPVMDFHRLNTSFCITHDDLKTFFVFFLHFISRQCESKNFFHVLEQEYIFLVPS